LDLQISKHSAEGETSFNKLLTPLIMDKLLSLHPFYPNPLYAQFPDAHSSEIGKGFYADAFLVACSFSQFIAGVQYTSLFFL
jgi:hypothetical protein